MTPADRPSVEDTLMHIAWVWAARSTCSYTHVGAVVHREGRILSSGYNGAPAGMPHCEHPPRVPGIPVQPCRTAVHAEANAIAFAARHGVPLYLAEMTTTVTPCVACAQLIVQAGITTVYADEAYRDPAGVELLKAASVEVVILGG